MAESLDRSHPQRSQSSRDSPAPAAGAGIVCALPDVVKEMDP
jgi:hypothetical protein